MLRLLICAMLMLAATPALCFDSRPQIEALRATLESRSPQALAVKTDAALSGLVRLAVWELNQHDHPTEAARIERRWHSQFENYLSSHNALGDHAPLSQFLTELYALLLDTLGQTLCEFLHFDDIAVFNYAIPVVFHLSSITEAIDATEYENHFDPFCGVVAYWTTWAACEVATWGSAWFLVCTPAGQVAEFVVYNFIAPQFYYQTWEIFYP